MHRHIFEVVCARRDAGEPIDGTLMRVIFGDADLSGVTVGSYLTRLYAEATTVTGPPGPARLIAQAAQMRRLLETAWNAAMVP